jgi:hypothetical protein
VEEEDGEEEEAVVAAGAAAADVSITFLFFVAVAEVVGEDEGRAGASRGFVSIMGNILLECR